MLPEFRLRPLPEAFEEDLVRRDRLAPFTAVDLQLTCDEIADDEDFTEHYGFALGPGHYRYQSLQERVGEAEMGRIRRFVAGVLHRLTGESDRFVWFIKGGLGPLDEANREDQIVLRGWVDEARINGSFVIFGEERDDLGYQLQRTGQHDLVRGAAGPGLSLARVLPALSLASPFPTSSVQHGAGADPFAALVSLLPRVGLFFEEIKNGTRLRLVSNRLSQEEISRAVEEEKRA